MPCEEDRRRREGTRFVAPVISRSQAAVIFYFGSEGRFRIGASRDGSTPTQQRYKRIAALASVVMAIVLAGSRPAT
jgi:hypothetical protein